MSQINIIPNNNEIVLVAGNRTVTIVNNTVPNEINVTQPLTQVVQILTGPMGGRGNDGTGSQGIPGPSGSSAPFTYVSGTEWFTTSSLLATGSFTGSFTGSLQGTSSYALTASYALNSTNVDTSSLVPYSVYNAFTGSYNTGSFTGSFTGDGSNILGIVSSSYSNTSSYSETSISASYAPTNTTGSFTGSFTGSLLGTASTASYVLNAVSSSFASTASYVTTAQTASYIVTAQTASYVLQSVSSSYASTASQALSASYAPSSPAFPYTGSAEITGSLVVRGTSPLRLEYDVNNYFSSSIDATGSTILSVVGGNSSSLTLQGGNGTVSGINYIGSINSSPTSTAAAHNFYVGNTGSSLALQILHSGNGGIGTTYTQTIGSTSAATSRQWKVTNISGNARLTVESTSGNAALDLYNNSNTANRRWIGIFNYSDYFQINNYADNGTLNQYIMTVDLSSGNVGFGMQSAAAKVHVIKTTEQLRVGYDASNYVSTTISSTGLATYLAVGTGNNHLFKINSGTAAIKLGFLPGFVNDSAIHIGTTAANTPTYGNHFVYGDGAGTTHINSSTLLTLDIASSPKMNIGSSGVIVGSNVIPGRIFEVRSTTANQVRIAYDTSNYVEHNISTTGVYTMTAVSGTSVSEVRLNSNDGTTMYRGGVFRMGVYNAGVSIGTSGFSPSARLEVRSTTEQLRLSYDNGNRMLFTVGSTGSVLLDAVGTNPKFTFLDPIELTQTTSSISPTSPDRTITMVVNGTTLYIPAKTTND